MNLFNPVSGNKTLTDLSLLLARVALAWIINLTAN
jgi:hypothetical protein